MIEEAIRSTLNGNSSITALIGSGTSMRCYPVNAPQVAAYPRLIMVIPQGENPATFAGRTTLRRDTIQIIAQSTNRRQARILADLVLVALNGLNSTVTLADASTLRIKGVFHQADGDDETPPAVGEETPSTYEVLKEFLFCYA
jgi:hypothetical protein